VTASTDNSQTQPASTVIEPVDPLHPLGDNTPSPEIQNVIEKLKLLAKQRQK
jgi:hypothetical protein